MIVGDYLSNIEFPFIYDSSVAYQKSLDVFEGIIKSQEIKIMIPGHGDFTSSKDEMEGRLEHSKMYLKNLLESISDKKDFDLEKLLKHYKFPMGLKKSHSDNIKLVCKELK